jgi:hypothetical protein
VRGVVVFLGLVAVGCVPTTSDDLSDDPEAYISDVGYRRGILERDLTSTDNDYAQQRLTLYGVLGFGWELLPERDPPSRPFTVEDSARLAAGEALERGDLQALAPIELPEDDAAWIALGRRTFFEYPLRVSEDLEALASDLDALEEVGFLVEDGEVVALRVFEDSSGALRVGHSCAQCHASRDLATGDITDSRSNRAMDIGAIQLRADGFDPADLPPELDSTPLADLGRLGPGRGDVLNDGVFNPYAFPDLGGLVDLPYLHHNANWHHVSVATLAVRCETLFITSSREPGRVPRALSWAISRYYRSLPPPSPLPLSLDPDEVARGEEIFDAATCTSCHVPPLYTSDRQITVEDIGTDPEAGLSPSRVSGHYRIPSLRGVGGNAPYLHHGAFDTLEAMFDPAREEPGHPYGLELDDADRAALLAFLRSL